MIYMLSDPRQLSHPSRLLLRQALLRGGAPGRVQALLARPEPEQAAAPTDAANQRQRSDGTSGDAWRRIVVSKRLN